MRSRNFVGIINPVEEVNDIAYCPRCEKRHIRSLLGEQVIIDIHAVLPPDYDQWKQCHKCGLKVPIYNVRSEGEVFSDLEIVENPFDLGKGIITGPEDRVKKDGTNPAYERIKKKKSRHKDPEVQKELDKGNVVTNYSTTM